MAISPAPYVRDKDGVGAACLICEMFSFYASRGISLLDRLHELYGIYGYCLNTLHSYAFDGSAGFAKMQAVMQALRAGVASFGGKKVLRLMDYAAGLDGLPKSDVLKFILEDGCTLVARPSGTEPKLKLYLSVSGESREAAEETEQKILKSAEALLHWAGAFPFRFAAGVPLFCRALRRFSCSKAAPTSFCPVVHFLRYINRISG